ncbi:protein of unknown function [Thermoanaerobacterium sp. RBIITD]|nr:protein of unknown function [Thermoanaerobacterium sp. RBIITD]
MNGVIFVNELGEILKNARLKKGMTLDDLQEITKVRTRYLKAIEDGNFDVIPALVYAKGFIKSYAQAVGINSDELLNKYSYLFEEKKEEEEKKQEAALASLEEVRSFDLFTFLRKLVKPFIGIIVIGLFVYGLYYMVNQINKGLAPLSNTNQVDKGKTNNNDNNKNDTTNNSVYNNVVKKTSIQQIRNTQSEFDYKVIPEKDTYKVDITIPGQKCWFNVKVDGASTYEGILTNGMTKSFDVKSNIDILMGNPPDVKITVDGQEIPHIDVPAPVTLKLAK